MPRTVNAAGVTHLRSLITAGKVNAGTWDFTGADGDALLGKSGDWTAFGRVHLAVNSEAKATTKAHYSYPVAKGGEVYRNALIAAKGRAAQQGDSAIADAASTLLDLIDKQDKQDKQDSAKAKKIERTCAGLIELKFISETEPGSFEGYGSVFNALDWHGDIVLPGAFAATLADHKAAGTMPGMFAEHSFAMLGGDPLPIGVWQDMSEDGNGLRVKGKLSALDSDTGRRMRGLMADGAMKGLSIAFSVPDDGADFGKKPGEPRRWLKKVDLYSLDVVRDPSNAGATVTAFRSLMAHADHAGAVAAVTSALALHKATMMGGDTMTADERGQMHDHLRTAYKCLTGNEAKAADRPDTIRDFEAFLRDAGYSNKQAREIAERGFKAAAAPRDGGAAADSEAMQSITESMLALRRLTAA